MPASLQEPCKHPPLIIREDARVVIAKYAAALNACNAKRFGAVAFYSDLQKGLAGK